MYNVRLKFPEVHEVVNENDTGELTRQEITALVFLDDSMCQFKLMTVEDDYVRSLDEPSHRERELLRLSTLIKRIKYVQQQIKHNDVQHVSAVLMYSEKLLHMLEQTENMLCNDPNEEDCICLFSCLIDIIELAREELFHIIPSVRPIDVVLLLLELT